LFWAREEADGSGEVAEAAPAADARGTH